MLPKTMDRLTFLSALFLSLAFVPGAHGEELLEQQLKNALITTQEKSGPLVPWQKELMTQEVLTQYQRFIKDYRATPQGLKVDVDEPSLKSYLSFYAPVSLNEKEPKILVGFKGDASCKKCVTSEGEISEWLQKRLRNRGWVPVKMTPQDLQVSGLKDVAQLESALEALAKAKNIPHYWLVSWKSLEAEEMDSVHVDENRVRFRSLMKIGGQSLSPQEREILDGDSIEAVLWRFFIGSMAELGSKPSLAMGFKDKEEMWIEVSGFKDFKQYLALKERFQNELKGQAAIEDQIVSKGRVVFSVLLQANRESVKKRIQAIPIDFKEVSVKVVVQ